jgi:Holliday junction resolvasome RuvABC DNA-binding subunit
MQHKRVLAAAHDHQLPANPMGDTTREELVRAAVAALGEMGFPEKEVAQVLPPVDELLP